MMLFFYLNKKFQKAKRYYRQFGIKKTFAKVIKTLFSKIYSRRVSYIVLEKNLAEEVKFPMDRKIRIQRIEESHLGILKELCERWNHQDTGIISFAAINDYFESGYHGFIAFLNDDIIGYFWWVDNRIKYKKNHPDFFTFNIEPRDKETYGFSFYMSPEYRGNGNAVEFLYKVLLALNKLGYNRVFGLVDPENTPARWLYKLVGFKDVRRITECRFLYFLLFMNKIIFLKANRKYIYTPSGFRAVYPFEKSKSLNERRIFVSCNERFLDSKELEK